MKDSLVYWVWLSSIPSLGSVRGRRLLEYFGSPEEIWNAGRESLLRVPDLGPVLVNRLTDASIRIAAEKHTLNIAKSDISVITLDSPDYPELLKEIYDPPLVLYKRGNFSCKKSIAVVGSRRASEYGLGVAEKLSYELACRGVNVVSGLARGIDSRAHEGAVKATGTTTAVLGCGVDIIYPPENSALYKRILSQGALLSEYLPGSPPLPGNFPARNRIISGLCKGVVVIEANEKSGSLITANFALEQGREVFSVPGNIGSTNSKGTNKLIREGAKIVTSVDDILDEITFYDNDVKTQRESTNKQTSSKNSVSFEQYLSDEEKRVIDVLQCGETHIDKLSELTGFDVKTLNSLLTIMELSGYVIQNAGKKFKVNNGI